MRGDAVVTRRTSLLVGASLAMLTSATMASAQATPPPLPPAQVVEPAPVAPPPPAPPAVTPAQPAAPSAAPQSGPPYPPPAYPPAMMIGPSRLPYIESEGVLPGYEIQTRPRMGMVKAGIATFAPLYGLSVLFGAAFLGSERGDAGKYGPMIIPLVGPFATIGTADTSEGTAFLLLDGVGQLAGAALFIAGMLVEEKYLERQTARFNLRPEVVVGPKSVAMRWQF